MSHLVYILFLFALGACVGSFLNVVIWRLPRGQSLVTPPSQCPKCGHKLAWYDNVPVFGWMLLKGRCRYCKEWISPKYPIIEAITGLLFVFYYVMFFILQVGPCTPVATAAVYEGLGGAWVLPRLFTIQQDWPIYALYMILISGLLAASLIDAELFIIPIEIPWLLAGVGIVVHAIFDRPTMPGSLNVNPSLGAIAAGGAAGLGVSMLLWWRGIMPTSFPQGEPLLEVDRAEMLAEIEKAKREGRDPQYPDVPPPYTKAEIRAEIRKEMLFLLPPMLLAMAWWFAMQGIAGVGQWWSNAVQYHWLSGLLGSLLGALLGGFVVWIFRILGTLGFGRVAMGLGDVHLMLGVGAIVGAGAATVAFFLAPFFGIVLAIYMLLSGQRKELPYGPYLSMATAFVLLFYCDIADYLRPGLQGLAQMIQDWMR